MLEKRSSPRPYITNLTPPPDSTPRPEAAGIAAPETEAASHAPALVQGPPFTVRHVRRLAYPFLGVGMLVMSFGFATTGSAKEAAPAPRATVVAPIETKATPVTPESTPTVLAASLPTPEATLTPEEAVVAPPGSTAPNALPPAAAPSLTPQATLVPPSPTPMSPTPPVQATPRPPTPRPAPAVAGAPVSMTSLEQDLFTAHNATRAAANIPALQMDPRLVTIARARAQDMATRNYFSHTSPGGDTAFSLLGQAAYTYTIAAENIARNNYPDAQAISVAMDGFLNSASHKENIIDPRFKTVGVGVAMGADGMKYIAVVFAG